MHECYVCQKMCKYMKAWINVWTCINVSTCVCVSTHIWKSVRVYMCVCDCECKDMHEYVWVTAYKSMWLRMWVNMCECEYGLHVSLVYMGVECCCSLFWWRLSGCLLRDLLSPCSVYMWLKTVLKAMAQRPHSPRGQPGFHLPWPLHSRVHMKKELRCWVAQCWMPQHLIFRQPAAGSQIQVIAESTQRALL